MFHLVLWDHARAETRGETLPIRVRDTHQEHGGVRETLRHNLPVIDDCHHETVIQRTRI